MGQKKDIIGIRDLLRLLTLFVSWSIVTGVSGEAVRDVMEHSFNVVVAIKWLMGRLSSNVTLALIFEFRRMCVSFYPSCRDII